MERVEREQYKRRIKTYEKLGALDFQKVVFTVERIKFKVLKKVWPNFINFFDKYCERVGKRELKKATTEEEKRNINRNINFAKLEMRKELNTEQNRNYHLDKDNSTEIYKYLEWNKDVHKKGLVKDLIAIPITMTASIALTPWLIPLLAYELFSAFVNFECVNIQNYNICRYKLIEDQLKRRQDKKVKESMEEYGDVAQVIQEQLETKEKLPTMTEIIDGLESTEQLEKFKKLLLREFKERQIEKNKLLVKENE